MTNKLITIKVLKNGYSFHGGGGEGKIKSAATIFNRVERKLGCSNSKPRHELKEKKAVRVIYLDGGTNETIDTKNPSEILYALAAFLEDGLTKDFLRDKYNKYGKSNRN
jgi:hypothetical protein